MAITDFYLLLLDDDPGRRASLEEAARTSGLQGRYHSVRTADDAVNYLQQAHSRKPSLLMLDLDRDSGVTLLEWLRGRPELRRILTIGLFDQQDGALVNRAYELGVRSCLVRPSAFDDQVAMFHSIRQYWETLNEPPVL